MFKNNYLPTKILSIGAILILSAATFCSVYFGFSSNNPSILPNFEIIVPLVNFVSLLLAITAFFFPTIYILQYFILIIQSIITIFTGYEFVGCFLFNLFIILFYIHSNISKKKFVLTITLLYFVFLISLIASIPYGIIRFIMALSFSLFISFSFWSLILLIQSKYTNVKAIINQALYISPKIQLPPRGEILYFSNFDLTERQKDILFEVLAKNRSYGEVSNKFNLSLSLVKKEISSSFCYFGCKNINSLRLIFSQFILKR